VAHKPPKLADVLAEAQKIADEGESLDTTVEGAEIGGEVAMPKGGLTTTGTATLASNFSIVGRAPDSGKKVSQVNAHVRRSSLFAAVGDELAGVAFGSRKSNPLKRGAASRKIATAAATKAKIKALNAKAMGLFKAQWNGQLAAGIAGVSNALAKDKSGLDWRAEIIKQAHESWNAEKHLQGP